MIVPIYHSFVCTAEKSQSIRVELPSDQTPLDFQGEHPVSLQLLIGVQIRLD